MGQIKILIAIFVVKKGRIGYTIKNVIIWYSMFIMLVNLKERQI